MGYDPEAGMLQREKEAASREERMTGGRMPRGDIDGEQPYKKPMGFLSGSTNWCLSFCFKFPVIANQSA